MAHRAHHLVSPTGAARASRPLSPSSPRARPDSLTLWDALSLLLAVFLVFVLVSVAIRTRDAARSRPYDVVSELSHSRPQFERGSRARKDLLVEVRELFCPKKAALYTAAAPHQELVKSTVFKPDASGYPAQVEIDTIDCWLPGTSSESSSHQAAKDTSSSGSAGDRQQQQQATGEVHVQYTADAREYPGMLASIHSALHNSRQPGRLRFHLTVPSWADERELCLRLLGGLERKAPHYICPADAVRHYAPPTKKVRECVSDMSLPQAGGSGEESVLAFPSGTSMGADSAAAAGESGSGAGASPQGRQQRRRLSLQSSHQAAEAALVAAATLDDSCHCGSAQFHIFKYSAELYEEAPRAAAQGEDAAAGALSSARDQAHKFLLPMGVERVIHLEPDTIVQGDLADVWGQRLGSNHLAAAVPTCAPSWLQRLNIMGSSSGALGAGCDASTAVYLLDLKAYRARVQQQKEEEEEQQQQLGVDAGLPEVTAPQRAGLAWVLKQHSLALDSQWHIGGLGAPADHSMLGTCTLRSGLLLHWSGPVKPWRCTRPGTCYDSYWQPYNLE